MTCWSFPWSNRVWCENTALKSNTLLTVKNLSQKFKWIELKWIVLLSFSHSRDQTSILVCLFFDIDHRKFYRYKSNSKCFNRFHERIIAFQSSNVACFHWFRLFHLDWKHPFQCKTTSVFVLDWFDRMIFCFALQTWLKTD